MSVNSATDNACSSFCMMQLGMIESWKELVILSSCLFYSLMVTKFLPSGWQVWIVCESCPPKRAVPVKIKTCECHFLFREMQVLTDNLLWLCRLMPDVPPVMHVLTS